MPIFAGLDIDQYPGDENMALLRAKTNLAFTGFYLAPAPSHQDTGWMAKRAVLAGQGWGFLPIYVGQEVVGPGSHSSSASAGAWDGARAAELAAQAGFLAGTYVYLDLENGPPMSPEQRSYIVAWAAALQVRAYKPGIYVSHLLADQAAQAVPGARIWVVKVQSTEPHDATHYKNEFPLVDPHAGGYQFAYAWQHEQDAEINVDGLFLTVDLNVSILPDPSR